ncbi:twin-arginine translocase subunit TatC [Dermacoccus nishinomiyaensis]|uniref:twin-arginine translocase subunit TatC n=1 Tax=Dermacoccus nishinomiyaensis TaxID=1274 RepID=UPI0009FACE39|nr:twin-arginine translocase subunit TatC [Dermacoccus nishinomiyaensis]
MAIFGRRKDNPEARMSIGDHLREFRNRAIVAGVAILLCCIIGWHYYQNIYDFIEQPFRDYQHAHPEAHVEVAFNAVTAPFNLKLKVVAWAGLILAAPVWLWQIWAFLVPGLTPREKRVGRIFIAAAIVLFACGVYMGSLTFGNAVEMFISATPRGAANFADGGMYFSFVTRFILSFGLTFMLPILLLALNAVGVLKGRIMLKGWRFAVIIAVAFAAIMTPTPDVYTMFLMAVPLIVLFFGSAGLALALDAWRARKEKRERPAWMDVSDDQASAL